MTTQCFNNHMGPWLCEPQWLQATFAAIKSGVWIPRTEAAVEQVAVAADARMYAVVDGVAVISMVGQMQKFDSKYGGVNTIRTRKAVRMAAADAAVGAIMLRIDSPGGTVAGTKELADDVRDAGNSKPVFAFGEDLLASAAYWVASAAKKIMANDTAEIGSIGTVAVVADTSKLYEMAGVTVHVISTGEFKGAFADGAPVTAEQLAYVQELVDDLNQHFLGAVADGRQMKPAEVKALADGKVMIAQKARKAGLIDAVMSFDAAMNEAGAVAQKRLESVKNRKKAEALINISASQQR